MRYLTIYLWLILFLSAVNICAQTDYQSVSVMRGDRVVLYWTTTTDYSSNFDVEFVVKATSDPSANRLIQKLNADAGGDSAQVYVTDDTIQVTINTANTLNWAARNYYYDILIEANGGGETDTTTIFQGAFTVLQDISSPTDGTVPGSIPVYVVALDTPTASPSFIIGQDSDNSVAWYSKRAFQDTVMKPVFTFGYGKISPSSSDSTVLFRTKAAITIDSIWAMVEGTTPSTPFNIKQGSSFTSMTGIFDANQTADNTTTGETFTPDNTAVAANKILAFYTGSVTGTTNKIILTVYYTY